MVSAPFPILRMMITTGDLNVIVNSKLILMNAHLKKTVVALMMSMACLYANADISTTSQRLDEFSFKKGLKVHGGLSFSNNFYAGSDSLVSRDPYAFYLNGNLNLNLWGIGMPFSFSVSNTQKSYTQPFNRFKLDPSYKWVHLLIGTNSMSLNRFTLSDHDFTGIGVELTPGKWNVSGMYGRLKKAVEYDPLKNNIDYVSYKRIGYAGKVGYTSNSGSYEVTFFHGEDDKNSLMDAIPDECVLTPKRNTAVSASVSQSFLKYFNFHLEYAISAYNTNLVNDQFDEVVTKTFIDKVFHRKQSDKMTDAIAASVGYHGPVFGINLQYERISPYYSSLGGYYFNSDEQNITIAPNLNLFKGKLSLSGNFGLQYNNLNNDQSTDTRHLVYSANISYNSGKVWSANASFSNFNTYTKVKPVSYPYYTDDLDTLNFYQVSRSLSLMNSFNFGSEEVKDGITLSTSYQTANSLQEDRMTSYSDFYSGSLSFNQQFVNSALGWSAYVTANYCNASQMETLYMGPGAGMSKSFFDGALNTSLSVAYNTNQVSGRDSGGLLNANLSASYAIKPKSKKLGNHVFSLSSGYTRYLGAMVSGDNEYESLTRLTYSVSF